MKIIVFELIPNLFTCNIVVSLAHLWRQDKMFFLERVNRFLMFFAFHFSTGIARPCGIYYANLILFKLIRFGLFVYLDVHLFACFCGCLNIFPRRMRWNESSVRL